MLGCGTLVHEIEHVPFYFSEELGRRRPSYNFSVRANGRTQPTRSCWTSVHNSVAFRRRLSGCFEHLLVPAVVLGALPLFSPFVLMRTLTSWRLLLIFYRYGTGGSEKSSLWPKATPLLVGRDNFELRSVWHQSSFTCLLLLLYIVSLRCLYLSE